MTMVTALDCSSLLGHNFDQPTGRSLSFSFYACIMPHVATLDKWIEPSNFFQEDVYFPCQSDSDEHTHKEGRASKSRKDVQQNKDKDTS